MAVKPFMTVYRHTRQSIISICQSFYIYGKNPMNNANMVNGFSGNNPSHNQEAASTQRREWNHNPNPGTISQAQINGLHAFTARNGQDLEEVAQRRFGVSVEDMSSKQAHELFGIFRNGRA